MASNSQKIVEAASTDSPTATPEVGKQSATTTEVERIKATRYPRWTRQETLLLIEAKKMVENRDHLCNFNSSSSILNHTDPKWNIVSSCIQQKGVKRGPLQCRKRWGNLLTDFRKVKKYETDTKGDDGESFWMMRSDKRKENKLPGFFDEVVFRVLDGEALSGATLPLALIKMASKPENSAENVEKMKLLGQSEDDEDDEDYEDDEDETVYDSEKKYWEGNSERKMVFSAIKASTSKETFLRGSVKVTPTLALALALAPPGMNITTFIIF
ncbi:putative transcription factor MYB-HB-like family [Lupinus albus]|uniref:Putative transcription factor MYB-HB-like family n=1 Tax=Lupinus albus TaxID=3870 RepID=A0A6A4PIU1_LUPAL|nr:putative transcription factor MYB-HB-like family [Lupinus albus]